MTNNSAKEQYQILLQEYIETKDEKYLYRAEKLSKSLLRDNILPEEIVHLHNEALANIDPTLSQEVKDSMAFLLETMISYGLAHQEFQTLRDEQIMLKSEISVAASMQETLLATEKPEIEGIDIGVISVPAHQMNGDYHHFIKANDGSLGVGIADVVGKGVPAALCMSMIKYSIDSLPEVSMSPKAILRNLNRVVERNVDASMFITMFYAQYMPKDCILRFASAGHEPGLHYHYEGDNFTEITTKGMVLGVLPEGKYEEDQVVIQSGDMVIFLTDGVTECRKDGRFLEMNEVLDVIKMFKHLPAQEQVNEVFKYFERLQGFQLRDDFTLIILKKDV